MLKSRSVGNIKWIEAGPQLLGSGISRLGVDITERYLAVCLAECSNDGAAYTVGATGYKHPARRKVHLNAIGVSAVYHLASRRFAGKLLRLELLVFVLQIVIGHDNQLS